MAKVVLVSIVSAAASVTIFLMGILGQDRQECTGSPLRICGAIRGPTLALLPPEWKVVGVADFNHDGVPDIVIFNEYSKEIRILLLTPEQVTN